MLDGVYIAPNMRPEQGYAQKTTWALWIIDSQVCFAIGSI